MKSLFKSSEKQHYLNPNYYRQFINQSKTNARILQITCGGDVVFLYNAKDSCCGFVVCSNGRRFTATDFGCKNSTDTILTPWEISQYFTVRRLERFKPDMMKISSILNGGVPPKKHAVSKHVRTAFKAWISSSMPDKASIKEIDDVVKWYDRSRDSMRKNMEAQIKELDEKREQLQKAINDL